MKHFTFYLLFFTLGITNINAQVIDDETSSEGVRLFYRTEMSGGAFIHTNGFGVNFRHGKRLTGYSKRILAVELLTMKHVKEFKSSNPYIDNNRGFVFGKMNALAILRPSFGLQKVWFSKDAKKGVQIGYFLQGGPSLGFLKPVYLEVADETGGVWNRQVKIEKFNPDRHNFTNIYGRAPVLKGIEETKLLPSLHAKFGLNFEYAPIDDMLRAIEVGIAADAFLKKIPIMAFETNRNIMFTLYLKFQFGRKYF